LGCDGDERRQTFEGDEGTQQPVAADGPLRGPPLNRGVSETILPWRRTLVLALHVHPSPSRPHRLSREGPAGGVYVRVGSTNRRADAALIGELRRFARGEGFDEQPMPALDSEALDFRAASESFAAFRKLARRDLETLRLLTDHQGRKVPTVGGMLLFGKVRERHFPDAWIQASRFDGTEKSRVVDRAEIRSLPVRRKERCSLPPAAVREAIVNAAAHADYAQRGAKGSGGPRMASEGLAYIQTLFS